MLLPLVEPGGSGFLWRVVDGDRVDRDERRDRDVWPGEPVEVEDHDLRVLDLLCPDRDRLRRGWVWWLDRERGKRRPRGLCFRLHFECLSGCLDGGRDRRNGD